MTHARPILALVLCLPGAGLAQETYRNPLPVLAGNEPVESCADPSVVADPAGGWIMYCTTDPLSAEDRGITGELRFRLLPTFRSTDLVGWTYSGDAFARDGTGSPPPSWAAPSALLWAPEGKEIGGRHYLLFGVTDTTDAISGEPGCASDGAIGYAVGPSPTGPWTAAPEPLVAPRRGGEGCDFLWSYDPEVAVAPDGRAFLYYGSYYGGIEVRDLEVASDGSLRADPATATPVAIPNRYEGAEVIHRDGAWWMLASASNCCNGPQTGYAVFAGRAEDPRGPFLDRSGASFLDASVGGTPVLVQNGNGWVGPGHLTLVEDGVGQWWALYHAIEEAAPWFEGEVGFTRRPLLLDRLSWEEGWPAVPGGPSDGPRAAPGVLAAPPAPPPPDAPGELLLAEDFDGDALDAGWTWLREPPEVRLEGGILRVGVTDTDLWGDRDDAPVLLRAAPEGDFLVEAQVSLDVAPEGCCQNFVQAGLALYGDDDNYLKLVVVSIWETRQTEFAREMGPLAPREPHYGSSVAGPPGEDWTWLRLVVRRGPEGETVTAWTSRDGADWVRGATWTHDLPDLRLGLVAMGGAGPFSASFEGLRVWALAR